MALVLIDGFDFYTAAQATVAGWSQAFTSMQAARLGTGQSARCPAGANVRALPSTYSTLIVGFAFDMTTSPTSTVDFFVIRTAAGANILRLQIVNGTPNLVKVLNSGGTVIATSTVNVVAGTWYYFEIKLVINGASGSVTTQLNGAADIATTTGNFGSTNAGQVGPVGAFNMNVDDLYVCDTTGSARNTFLGDIRVATSMANADGAHSQWTPDSGSAHFSRINEAQADGDTSYVSDVTPGDIDTYVFDDVDPSATVLGVQVNLHARKDDAGIRQIAPVIRESGTDHVGTTVTLGSTYSFTRELHDQDPTGSDWTASSVNAAEFGVKEIA
jgi:hypothetical protein